MQRFQKLFPKYTIAIGLLFLVTVAYLVSRGNTVEAEVGTVNSGELIQAIYATGFVEADAVATLSAEYSGTVRRVGALEGERVRAGQLLLQIDSPQPGLGVREAQAALAAQQAVLDDSRRNYERKENLLAEGALSRQEFDSAARSLAEAGELLRQKASRLGIARDELKKLTVRAPFAGVLTLQEAKEGDYLQAGTLVATVVDTSSYEVVVEVDELDVPRVRKGQAATVALDAFPEERFEAVVTRTVPQTDRVTKTSRVYLELAGAPAALQAGMTVTANIVWATRPGTLLVQRSAVFEEGRQRWVWKVEAGKLRKQAVRTGSSDLSFVEIIEGLADGDRVVLAPEPRFRDGFEVRALKPAGS